MSPIDNNKRADGNTLGRHRSFFVLLKNLEVFFSFYVHFLSLNGTENENTKLATDTAINQVLDITWVFASSKTFQNSIVNIVYEEINTTSKNNPTHISDPPLLKICFNMFIK